MFNVELILPIQGDKKIYIYVQFPNRKAVLIPILTNTHFWPHFILKFLVTKMLHVLISSLTKAH